MKKLAYALVLLSLVVSGSASHAAELSTFQVGNTVDRFYGFLQVWNINSDNNTLNDHTLRFRRAEMHLDSTLTEEIGTFLAIDPARFAQSNSNTLPIGALFLDFGMKYTIAPKLELKIGQFKIPTTAEGLDSAGDIPLIERSLVGRTFGDLHYTGVQISYKTQSYKISSMVTSGQGIIGNSSLSINNLVTRFEYFPTQDLTLGTFGLLGNFNLSTRDRLGLNMRYKFKKADFRVEYVQARDSGVQSHGSTGEIGYWITGDLQSAARIETFSPSQDWDTSASETVGLNYYFRNINTKVQLAGSSMQSMKGVNGSAAVSPGTNGKMLTVGIQASI